MPVYQPPDTNVETVTATKKPNFLAGLLGSVPLVGPLLQSGAQFLFDSIAARKQRKLALENWNRENEYNAPAAMMQRYREAGVNPAYANNMNLSQANSTISDDAGVVARAQVPNAMSMLQEYVSLKHGQAEATSAAEVAKQEKLKTYLLEKTLWDEIEMKQGKNMAITAKAKQDWMTTAQKESLFDSGRFGEHMKYNLDATKLFNEQMRGKGISIENAIKNLTLNLNKKGLNASDSTFLRVLSMLKDGEGGANDIFPYVIGDRAASFAGDLVKIGIPSGAISKMWSKTRPMSGSKPSGKMQPNNNFYD